MKPSNYTTLVEALASYEEQNLLKNYLLRKIPLNLNVTEENFEEFALALSGLAVQAGRRMRSGKGQAGGADEDIRVALSAASGIRIPDNYYAQIARKPKTTLTVKLKKAWQEDDVDALLYMVFGLEKNASMAVIDHLQSDLVQDLEAYYEHNITDEEPEEIPVPAEIDEWIEVIIGPTPEPVNRKKQGGNQHKPRKKPAARASKQLEMEF